MRSEGGNNRVSQGETNLNRIIQIGKEVRAPRGMSLTPAAPWGWKKLKKKKNENSRNKCEAKAERLGKMDVVNLGRIRKLNVLYFNSLFSFSPQLTFSSGTCSSSASSFTSHHPSRVPPGL